MRLQLKFNPSLKRELAPGDRRLWILRAVALRIERNANPLWVFEIFHRRLLIALGGLAVAGYLLAATGLYVWLQRQPHNQVGWFDIAAPWRWSGLTAKRGDTAVLAGLEALTQREYTDAFYQLRVGLARSPGNVEGRLTLARMYAGYDSSRAMGLLEEGLPHAPGNERLLGALLEVYAMLQARERALATVDGLLKGPATGRYLFMLQRARISLLVQQQRYPEAAAALAAVPAPADAADRASLQALQVELLMRTGLAGEVRPRIEALLKTDAPLAALRQCGEAAVTLGDADLMQSILRRMMAREPEAPGAYLYAIQAWHQLKRLSLFEDAQRNYFQLFGANDGALQAVAALAVNLDLPDLVNRARQVAAANRLSQFAYRVHLTEIALRRGDADQAMRSLRDWETNVETLKPAQRFYPEFIRRLTKAAFAGTPDQLTALLGHLGANRFQARLPVYDLAITVLEKAGQADAAGQITRAGLQVYPYSAPLLAAGSRAEARQQAAAVAAAAATAAMPAGPALPATAPQALQQLDAHLAADELAAARDLLRAIRAQKPSWAAASEGELAVRDVELGFRALDALAGRSAARSYLDRYRSDEEALRLVALARRLMERNLVADARVLHDEIAGSSGVGTGVKLALKALNLPDDLAGPTASQAGALAALDRFIAVADWTQAERLLRQLRDKPPEWLAAGAMEVKAREVLVRLGLDQRPLALTALKDLVLKGGAARSAAFKLVRDLLAREEQDNALILARELLKLLPGDPAATRLVKEAETPHPAGG